MTRARPALLLSLALAGCAVGEHPTALDGAAITDPTKDAGTHGADATAEVPDSASALPDANVALDASTDLDAGADVGPTDSGVLAAFDASTADAAVALPFSVISPTPEIISWPLPRAYPGIAYDIRLAVVGGKNPYRFTLPTGPTGMTITPDRGEIRWTPDASLTGQTFPVTARVQDAAGSATEQRFDLEVTTSGFRFVSPDGDDAADGSVAHPWKSLATALGKGVVGDTLYVRGGSYVGGFSFVSGKTTQLIAYPGESPSVDLALSTINVREPRTYVDGLELFNARHRGFNVDGSQDQLVFRRNHLHHLYDPSVSENPAFIFFWDADYYEHVVIQDNVFHDLFDRGSGINGDTSANHHGGSSVWYNVRRSLYEDNEAYAIDGDCMKDKDHGQLNTFRGNYLHDCTANALGLASQYFQEKIEVTRNVLVGTLTIGSQPKSIREIDVSHNTVLGHLAFGVVVGDAASGSFTVRDNVLVNPDWFVYASANGSASDLACQKKLLGPDGRFDYNLIDSAYPHVFGFDWYATKISLATWQSTYGKDVHSRAGSAQFSDLAAKDFRPLAKSPACGGAADGTDLGALPCRP